ncbi:hypothetical protein DNL40_06360 [Xylanimonas oleitrophica]|uniref:Uncharacterized protein n=1 Tax=Xylanimonas oleitrophica TaxID=2607479 RepID=A0A2W5WSD4_9MICO|nr:hypothetical protein [Xylanimonas oleitrophica]PZR53742.1 hypothetical protein DNL40_06360 [Xylanimonas oleitrophica]
MDIPLLLADHRAGSWSVLDGTGSPLVSGAATLAEHAGVLRLPAGAPGGARAVFADDALGTLVVLDDAGARRVPVAIPAEHLACDASGRYVVATTGMGASWEPWSDLVTVVDLADPDGTTAVRVRVRTGEPGVAVVPDTATGELFVVLRHRQPGEAEAIPLSTILAAGPHCPAVRGETVPLTGDLGHGDAADQRTGMVHLATEAGIERLRVRGGHLERLETWPWPVPGRAYFLRLDPAEGVIVGSLRGGAPDPTRWHTWTNHVARWSLDGDVDVTATGEGLVFRPDVHRGTVGWSVVHPDGDRLVLLDHGRLRETPLPSMSAAPRPGATPWDTVDGRSAQRRALALVGPDRAAVTRGGDGELHVVGPGGVEATFRTGTPLDEGGHLAALHPPVGHVDGVGR